jgi:hypothetical protein
MTKIVEGQQKLYNESFSSWCERHDYKATKIDLICSGSRCIEWYRLRAPGGISFDVNLVTNNNEGQIIKRRDY